MAFKTRQKEDELIKVKIIFDDGSFELVRVTLEEFVALATEKYMEPRSYFKGGKGYPFPDEEDWEELIGGFVVLQEA